MRKPVLYKTDPGKIKIASTMQDPCINISEMLNLNQMCWQQMPLDLLKQGCAEGMKMYTNRAVKPQKMARGLKLRI